MAGKVKTWIWIVVAIAVVGVLGIIAMAGAGLYFFSQHVETVEASPAVAARSFDEVKARFAAQAPLITVDDRGNVSGTNTPREPQPNGQRMEAVHVLAYDPNDARVVRLSIPFWLLRLKAGNATINLNGNRMDIEDLKINIEDLERVGPTLIVDHTSPQGDRVLVWTQ